MNRHDAVEYIASRSDYFSELSDRIWDHPEVRFTETFLQISYAAHLRRRAFKSSGGWPSCPPLLWRAMAAASPASAFWENLMLCPA